MELYIDDCLADAPAAESQSLGVLVEGVKTHVASQGRILVGISCDGIDVTGEDFGDQLARPVGEFRRIDMQSAEPAALVAQALDVADGLLAESAAGCDEVVALLSRGNTRVALDRLGTCCKGWMQVHQAVCQALTLLGMDANTVQVDGEPLARRLEVPAHRLRQIKEAISGQDYVLLADSLTYEFPEAVESWRSIIAALRESRVSK